MWRSNLFKIISEATHPTSFCAVCYRNDLKVKKSNILNRYIREIGYDKKYKPNLWNDESHYLCCFCQSRLKTGFEIAELAKLSLRMDVLWRHYQSNIKTNMFEISRLDRSVAKKKLPSNATALFSLAAESEHILKKLEEHKFITTTTLTVNIPDENKNLEPNQASNETKEGNGQNYINDRQLIVDSPITVNSIEILPDEDPLHIEPVKTVNEKPSLVNPLPNVDGEFIAVPLPNSDQFLLHQVINDPKIKSIKTIPTLSSFLINTKYRDASNQNSVESLNSAINDIFNKIFSMGYVHTNNVNPNNYIGVPGTVSNNTVNLNPNTGIASTNNGIVKNNDMLLKHFIGESSTNISSMTPNTSEVKAGKRMYRPIAPCKEINTTKKLKNTHLNRDGNKNVGIQISDIRQEPEDNITAKLTKNSTGDNNNPSNIEISAESINDNKEAEMHTSDIDWEAKIPMDVITYMDATDPNVREVITPSVPNEKVSHGTFVADDDDDDCYIIS